MYIPKLEDVITCNQPVLPVIYSEIVPVNVPGEDGMGASDPKQDFWLCFLWGSFL